MFCDHTNHTIISEKQLLTKMIIWFQIHPPILWSLTNFPLNYSGELLIIERESDFSKIYWPAYGQQYSSMSNRSLSCSRTI